MGLARISAILSGVCLIVLVCFSSHSDGRVIGIDLGNEYFKIALVQRGAPFTIVSNIHSKRKTETMVAFDGDSRLFGSDAAGLATRKPAATYSQMLRVLGRNISHCEAHSIQNDESFGFSLAEDNERNTVKLVGQPSKSEQQSFTAEELVAMILGHAKDLTARGEGTGDVRDVVLTVPSFWTQSERQALLDAAGLVDLNVLSLIDENAAAALQLAINMSPAELEALKSSDNGGKVVLFYNMGATRLQVSVVKYRAMTAKHMGKELLVPQMEVLGKAWDDRLGGIHFDQRVTNFIADKFNESYRQKKEKQGAARSEVDSFDVRKIPRAIAKIMKQASKTKTVLSANNYIPINLGSVYDDMDFHAHITRSEFEEMAADLMERVTLPVQVALKEAGLTPQDVNVIELIGGGVRVPKIQQELKDFFGEEMELGAHLNGDEAMALGAAFRAANLSTAFRVRPIGISDIFPYSVKLNLEDLPETHRESKLGKVAGFFSGLLGGGSKEGDDSPNKDLADEHKASKDTHTEAGEDGEDGEGEVSSSGNTAWSKKTVLFRKNHKLGARKVVAFYHDRDILTSLLYGAMEDDKEAELSAPENLPKTFLQYKVEGIDEFVAELESQNVMKPRAEREELLTAGSKSDDSEGSSKAAAKKKLLPKVQLTYMLDDSGLVSLVKAEAIMEEEVEVEVNSAADSDNKEGKTESEGEADSGKDEAEAKADKNKDSEAAENSEGKDEEEKKTKLVSKFHKKDLKVQVVYAGNDANAQHRPRSMSEADKQKSVEVLRDLEKKDEERKAREEAKNVLESFLYSARDQLTNEGVDQVSTEEQRQEILDEVENLEDWLYGDGENLPASEYTQKYKDLKQKVDLILFRFEESTARPSATATAKEFIEKKRQEIGEWKEKLAHITEEEKEQLLDSITKFESWLSEKVEEQSTKKGWEEAVYTSSQVNKKRKALAKTVQKLARKPKPTEPPAPKPTPSTNETSTETPKTETGEPSRESENEDLSANSTTSISEEPTLKEEDAPTGSPKEDL